jgi:hypothetical protein
MHCTGSNVALSQSNPKDFQSFKIVPSISATALSLTAKRHATVTLHMHSESATW